MTDTSPPITAAQSRAGRALVGWSLPALAEATAMRVNQIEQFEAETLDPDVECPRAIRTALEAAGVLFLPEQGGEGVGVRLKFPRLTVKRIQTWEGEGGTTGEDDIP
ncbi:XRE family transcriptional regulator [Devosia sp. XGJD_8]|uniref:XRE family transcriptional regulator n=1 Tax=Devosia sp. XGJD_8 TaxID=3391187 RepID=UPI0039849551